MHKRDLFISIIAGALIGILTIPTINNLPLPEQFISLGTGVVALALGVLSIIGFLLAEALGRWLSLFKQIGRFAIVGVLNTVLDFAVLNSLITVSGIAEGPIAWAFKGFSFIVAVVNSYYWNKYWTFEFRKKIEREFLRFFVVSVVGFGLNVGAFSVVVNLIGPVGSVTPEVWANLGALAGTLAGLIWNFLGYKLIVFKEKTG